MKKPLLETNPYLKDPEQRKRLLRRSLVSSFAIEGIHLSPCLAHHKYKVPANSEDFV